MNCPTCGSENAPDSRFCEDCGAQLTVSQEGMVAVAVLEGPLAPGRVLQERWRVDELLEEGRINRYLAADLQSDEQPVLLLECSDASLLGAQHDLVRSLEAPFIWTGNQRFEEEGRLYLAGPRPGLTRFEQEIAGEPSPERVARVGVDLLRGLEALHQHGLLHLALQPSRIWTGGEQAVLDPYERLCRAQSPEESYSVTPGYSSPEAYGMQGGVLDPRSDLFSLGAVLHFALSRQRPDLESRESFFSFPRLSGGKIGEVIMRAVSKAPADRFASAGEMLHALEDCLADSGQVPATSPVVAGYEIAMKTDIGCVRSINQDACAEVQFVVWEKDVPTRAHLVVVADGMGGEAEGDKAASLAVRSLAREVLTSVLHFQVAGETNRLLPTDPIERARVLLERGIETANRSIHDYAELDMSRRGMGCTMTAVLLVGDTAVLGHVGDTRGYRFRGQELDLVTTDHSLVGRLVQMGQMSREEARNSPQRSIIYRALGTNPEVEVDLYERRLAAGDYLLICSDGVWEYYQDEELSEFFARGPNAAEAANWLVATCLERGADDNATCAIIRHL
ncbi:MAG: hypothetical protein AMXMBFR33_05250 [Candidatus Xenobia bacterium]